MSSIELAPSQKSISRTLTNLHKDSEDTVKGEDIAEQVDRNPGTIRNQMQSLKALQLVEGVPGPKGGYKPTAIAYEALEIQQMDEPASVPLTHEGEYAEDVIVEEIDLSSVHHPELCRTEVYIQGSVDAFHEDDAVTVGPTPLSKSSASRVASTGKTTRATSSSSGLTTWSPQLKSPLTERLTVSSVL